MIPKRAIEKAIEGGWRPDYLDQSFVTDFQKLSDTLIEMTVRGTRSHIALDPTFWQALGKALDDRETLGFSLEYLWKRRAREFYDLILTGGNTEAFWNDLLA